MFKKSIFAGVVLFGFVFLQVTEMCFADEPQARLRYAWKHKEWRHYEKAEGLYRAISIDYPGTDYDLEARREVVFMDITLGKNDEAQGMLDSLISDFSKHPSLPEILYGIAQRYERERIYEKAKALYQQITQQYPTCPCAEGAASHLRTTSVLCLIRSGDYPAAQEAIDRLKADFSGDSLSGKLCRIASEYGRSGKNEEAASIYQGVIADYPGTEDAFNARRALVILYISMGNYTAAQQALDKLTAEFPPGESDLPRALYFIAKAYEDTNRYEEALSTYRTIIKDYPSSDYALTARKRLVSLYDSWKGSEGTGKTASPDLAAAFSGYSSSPEMLYNLAKGCEDSNRYEAAKSIYQNIVTDYNSSEYSVEAQKELVLIHMRSGGGTEEQEALYNQFVYLPGHPGLAAEALYAIAQECEKQGKTELANRAYINAMWMDVHFFVGEGNDTEADKVIDNMIASFGWHKDLPAMVCRSAEIYYRKGRHKRIDDGDEKEAIKYIRKAIGVWEKVVSQVPKCDDTARAYYCAAVCYSQELKEYAKGIEYYRKVVENWPNYRHAWHAQYFIGTYYERLKETGAIDKIEADTQIEQAYKAVVEKYPDSNSAGDACLKLGQINFGKSQWVEAAVHFEMYLQKAPKDGRWIGALYKLGLCYEKMGQKDLACGAYGDFIAAAGPNDGRVNVVKGKLAQCAGQKK